MHLIFLHGAPGVGKRTIATELSRELQFPFINFQHLSDLLTPVFGYASSTYDGLRDSIYRSVIERALKLPEDGLIASVNLEPTISLPDFGDFIQLARDSGGIGLFIGLRCASDDLKARSRTAHKVRVENNSDLDLLANAHATGAHAVLPGPSISIDTTGEMPEETIQNILAMLPDNVKQNMAF